MDPDDCLQEWQSFAAGRHGNDGLLRPLPDLAGALSRTAIRSFFPIMSTNSLCFAEGATYPFEGIQPAFVVLAGDDLVVYSGHPLLAGGNRAVEVLVTGDPTHAAAQVVQLFNAG